MTLQAQFDAHAPWITKYQLRDSCSGGMYDAFADLRIKAFRDWIGRCERVLELGCLEGGHTISLSRMANQVVAIDCRKNNLLKTNLMLQVYGRENVSTEQLDLEVDSLSFLGDFDVVFNVGVLYHLQRPWLLLEKLSTSTTRMFLWTHIAPETELVVFEGRQGWWYGGERGVDDPLSGLSSTSFWLSKIQLLVELNRVGFTRTVIINEELDHPNGPAILLQCTKKTNELSRHRIAATSQARTCRTCGLANT